MESWIWHVWLITAPTPKQTKNNNLWMQLLIHTTSILVYLISVSKRSLKFMNCIAIYPLDRLKERNISNILVYEQLKHSLQKSGKEAKSNYQYTIVTSYSRKHVWGITTWRKYIFISVDLQWVFAMENLICLSVTICDNPGLCDMVFFCVFRDDCT